MADDLLGELLSSPLDSGDDASREQLDGPPRVAGPWLVVGLVVGALAVFGGYLLASGDDPTEATTTSIESTTSTSLADVEPEVSFPPGYVAVDDGRVGVRVERVLVRPDAVFVSISTVVPRGIDGEESAAFDGGTWELEMSDGRVFDSNTEATSPASPGFITVRFINGGYRADDIAAFRLTGVATRFTDQVTSGSGSFTIPADGSPVDVSLTPETFTMDSGVTVALTSMTMGAESGSLIWELQGSDTEALASVFPQATLVDAETGDPHFVLTQGDFGGFVFAPAGDSFFGDAPLSRQAEVEFRPGDPVGGAETPTFPTGIALRAELDIGVTWVTYSPEAVVVPITDTAIAEVSE